MAQVVNDDNGTSFSARVVNAGLLMAGKSGTAQVRNISAAERETGVVTLLWLVFRSALMTS